MNNGEVGKCLLTKSSDTAKSTSKNLEYVEKVRLSDLISKDPITDEPAEKQRIGQQEGQRTADGSQTESQLVSRRPSFLYKNGEIFVTSLNSDAYGSK